VTQYVFDSRRAFRYRFPTHTNDLIMDRQDATAPEAFFVILEPGEAPPIHVQVGVEQVFYVLEGEGLLTIGKDPQKTFPVRAGDLVRIPPGIHHAIRCTGPDRFVYLSVDCFVAGSPADEPTWESHVRVMCAEHGWDFDLIQLGPVADLDAQTPLSG
jgi:mannose-6-phosphate isomerase-like protein (cupin superfamily)